MAATARYQSFVLTFDVPFDWAVFSRVMDALAVIRGEDLLRVKGFVNVAGCVGPVVVHYVQHLAAPPEELAAWPQTDGAVDRRTRLVFITRDLSRRQVTALFAAHLDLLPEDVAAIGLEAAMPAG